MSVTSWVMSDEAGGCGMDRLEGTALITGGGRGVGASIARELASAGMRVVVAARTPGEVTAVAREIGGRALIGDVANKHDVDAWMRETGPIDLLVANAGIVEYEPEAWGAGARDWWRVFEPKSVSGRRPTAC
jgi:NADP-dependent 3-hydroxy acid dehydrogenase YdfG